MTREILFSVTLDDCDVQTFRAGGPGGQNQNKRETGVRIVHTASGAVGECREERSQHSNKRTAFIRMTEHPKFQFWVREKKREMESGKSAQERVEEMMHPAHLVVEGKVDGKWTKLND